MALKHLFVSAVADGPDATKLRPSNWGSASTDYSTAPTHVFDGGALGSLLMRDTGAVDGSSWLAAGAAGLVLTSNGVGVAPTWQAGGGGGGGLFDALTDPNVDRIPFWDDSAGSAAWLAPGNSVAITGTTFDTIQDIRTTATPTFGGIQMFGAAATTVTNPADGFAVTLQNHITTDCTDPALDSQYSVFATQRLNFPTNFGSGFNTGGIYALVYTDASSTVTLRTHRAVRGGIIHNGSGTMGVAVGIVGRVDNIGSAAMTTARGVEGTFFHSGSGTVATAIAGAFSAIVSGTGTATNMFGCRGSIESNTSGTVTAAQAVWANIQHTGGTLTTAYGVRVNNLTNTATITTTYGVHVGDITTGTQTNQAWSFYASDENARNYFGGRAESPVFRTTTALVTAVDGGATAAFTANMVGSTGGPTTAAQNGWVKMQDSTGATVWVPVWK